MPASHTSSNQSSCSGAAPERDSCQSSAGNHIATHPREDPMKTTRSLRLGVALLALAAGSLCTFARAQPINPPPWPAEPVVGVWLPEITLRDCASGTALEVFRGMSVLHYGGTLSETNTSPPGTRGPGFGTWQRLGANSYASQFRFLRYFPDGNLAGATVIRRQFTLSADGQQQVGSSQIEIQIPGGFVVATACATDVTVRFQ
jgi:hypothetical protein